MEEREREKNIQVLNLHLNKSTNQKRFNIVEFWVVVFQQKKSKAKKRFKRKWQMIKYIQPVFVVVVVMDVFFARPQNQQWIRRILRFRVKLSRNYHRCLWMNFSWLSRCCCQTMFNSWFKFRNEFYWNSK